MVATFFFPPRRPSGDFLADPVHALFPGRLRSVIGACEQLWWNSIDLAELIKGKGVQSNRGDLGALISAFSGSKGYFSLRWPLEGMMELVR